MGKQTINVFLAILKAGLWEQDVILSQYGKIDFIELFHLAEEQSVTGLLAAGLDCYRHKSATRGGIAVCRSDITFRAMEPADEWFCCKVN